MSFVDNSIYNKVIFFLFSSREFRQFSPFENRRERRSQSAFSSASRTGGNGNTSFNFSGSGDDAFPPGQTGSLEFFRSGSGGESSTRHLEDDFVGSRSSGGSFEMEDSYAKELREYGVHQQERREQQYKDRSRSLSPHDRCVSSTS